MTCCSATAWTRMLTLCMLFVLLLGFFLSFDSIASLSCVVTMAEWNRRWKPIWISYAGNFHQAHMEEWEQEVYASENSDQEQDCHWRDQCPRFHQSHDFCDESESDCGLLLNINACRTRLSTCAHGRPLECIA